jgi:tetratricopeptide (TPR) repeat protein
MRLFLFLLIAVTLFSCVEKPKPLAYTFLRNDALLFNQDSVRHFLNSVSETQADSSKQAFLKAIDLLKNSNNAAQSIALFQQSLAIYPNANAYYELGNAYLQNKEWQAALQSFEMAEAMDYKPLGNVFFKQASCYAELDSLDKVYEYITYAVQNGFVDKARIVNDVHFADFKNDRQLLTAYNEAMSGNGDPEEVLWQGYSNDFKQAAFPFTVDTGTLRKMGEPQAISYDYEKFVPEMRDNKFSRDVGSEYFYVAKIMQTELSHVVLYGCRSYEEIGAPVYYILASFNPKGKLVDKMIVGGAKNFDENVKVFTAKSNNRFQIEEYQNTYEKSTDENGYENNKVVSRQLVGTKQFAIDAAGKFVAAQLS